MSDIKAKLIRKIVKQDAYNEIADIINSYIKVGAPQDVIS